MFQPGSLATAPPPWGRVEVMEDVPVGVRLGPMDLWFQYHAGEMWLARKGVHPDAEPEVVKKGEMTRDPPAGLEWSRWATPSGEREVSLRPAFPDRPLVVGPERPFRLMPRAQAQVYVRVPLWIRVELPGGKGDGAASMLLDEFPSAALSDTWWGNFMEGELAYWLSTTARREMRPELFAPHLAACPLLLINRSPADLAVEKLSLRVEHLSLFADGDHLWANTSNVFYHGEDEGSQVEMTARPPVEATGGKLVAHPRRPVQEKGFRARTFQRLMALPGIGGD